jgi:elongation factor P
MLIATDLRPDMVLRMEDGLYRVLEAVQHSGTAKLSGFVHARLLSLSTGSQTERRFRLDEKLEDVPVDKRTLQFLYQDGDDFYFMDPQTFEQTPLPRALIGAAARFLKEGMQVPVEFVGEAPVAVAFPATVDLQVASTAQPMRATQTSAMKRAVLENGLETLVPLFIKEGDLVRIEVATGKYLERVREARR